MKSIYECFGQILANRVSDDPGYDKQGEEELIVFRPWPWASKATYVNVDTTSKSGINRAEKLGLVPSGLADLVITSDPVYAVEHLYDKFHKGRALALFRHPVERLVSKFYYLQMA